MTTGDLSCDQLYHRLLDITRMKTKTHNTYLSKKQKLYHQPTWCIYCREHYMGKCEKHTVLNFPRLKNREKKNDELKEKAIEVANMVKDEELVTRDVVRNFVLTITTSPLPPSYR